MYPPFWGTGIKIASISQDYREIKVEMALRFYNKNVVGTHFGGNLLLMTDPFLMLMLIKNMGLNAVVWDKSTKIDFIKPGRGKVTVLFKLSEEDLHQLRSHIEESHQPILPTFTVEIVDQKQAVVAKVTKTLYIRAK